MNNNLTINFSDFASKIPFDINSLQSRPSMSLAAEHVRILREHAGTGVLRLQPFIADLMGYSSHPALLTISLALALEHLLLQEPDLIDQWALADPYVSRKLLIDWYGETLTTISFLWGNFPELLHARHNIPFALNKIDSIITTL